MSVLVAYSHTAEGRAALRHGLRLASIEQIPVVAFDLDTPTVREDRGIDAPEPGVDHSEIAVRWIGHRKDDPDAADELLDTSEEIHASMIVVGIRRRSAVGKLLLGSNAQRIILGADVPVLAVKADTHDH